MRSWIAGGALFALAGAGQPVTAQAPYAMAPNEAAKLLVMHNRARSEFRYLPMTWDPQLAARAQIHANHLARIGRLVHAPKSRRPGQGENLAMGFGPYSSIEWLAGTWLAERRLFKPGVFPNTSRTGHWADAGHYSQMVWPVSVRLGCGKARGRRMIFLVCRYSPAGNRDGVSVGR
jgi:hypothetical protein